MARNRSFRRQCTHRMFVVAALAAPLIAAFSPLSVLPAAASTTAAAVYPGPGAAGAARHKLQLSIGVTDSRQRVQSGDLITYAVEVHNIGKRNAPRLSIVQTLPAGLKFLSASRHPAVHAGRLTWRLSLAAGHTSRFRVEGRVGKTPAQLLRLATIACATTGASSTPIVCAAHSDELPAGVVAAAQASQDEPGSETSAGRYLRPAGAALVLAIVAGGGYLLFRRRHAGGRRAS